ncbi:DUF3331 domain-containing protein [Burkholderia sp. Bp9031]|uniref:DUF3331 domain-containing protein n=1 Tax=Burkholderia sp. Bp9031 TaxID=2184566 RepID=UPI0009EB4F0B|nr:DUF3331 domain-containing protein [Burkholderia sp. Bp9031]
MSARVQVLAYSDELLIVRWHAAGRAEQRWSPGRALRSGHCALSGEKIVCGDVVFSPRGRAAADPNAMILAAALDRPHVSTVRPQVRVLERSSQLLLVRWVEPGRAHFGEQHWKPGRARQAGTCALSGARIARGDRVFRPSGRPMPPNAGAMILAIALDGADLART